MGQNRKKDNFLMQGSILAIAGIIVRLIGMVYRVPLTRIVGREGMSYYNSAYDLYSLALLLSSYSIPVAVSKLVSAKEAAKEYRSSYRIFMLSMILAISVGFAGTAIIFFGADFFAGLTGWPSAALPLRVLAPTILVFAVMGVIRGFFQGKKMMVPTAFSQIIEQIVNAVVSIVAATLLVKAYTASGEAAAYGAAGGTLGTLLGAVAGLIVLLFIYKLNSRVIHKRRRSACTNPDETYGSLMKLIIFTMLPIILSQTIYQLSGTIDNIIYGNIMQLKGYEESSKAMLWEAYSNKYKWLVNVPVAVASAYGVSIVPSLISSYVSGDRDAVRHKIASSVKLNMLIAIPSAVGLGVLGQPIISLLFGGAADAVSPRLMQLGAVAVVFFSLSTLTNGVLQGINKMKIPVIHSAISLGVHVVLIVILFTFTNLGIYSFVIGNVTYGLLVSILNWQSIGRYVKYKQEIVRTFLLPLAAAAVMGTAAYFVNKLLFDLTGVLSLSTLTAIAAAAAIYGVMLIVLRAVNANELRGMPGGRIVVKVFVRLHLMK